MSENDTAQETWGNPSAGKVYILTFDHTGKLQSQLVRPGGKVQITTQERLINQERAASPAKDVFNNGRLHPVRIHDSAEGYAEITSNPNLLSEDDLKELFNLKIGEFRSRLGEISNSNALQRLHDFANGDDEDTKVTMTQAKAIDKRLAEVTGKTSVDVDQHPIVGTTATTSLRQDLDSI